MKRGIDEWAKLKREADRLLEKSKVLGEDARQLLQELEDKYTYIVQRPYRENPFSWRGWRLRLRPFLAGDGPRIVVDCRNTVNEEYLTLTEVRAMARWILRTYPSDD